MTRTDNSGYAHGHYAVTLADLFDWRRDALPTPSEPAVVDVPQRTGPNPFDVTMAMARQLDAQIHPTKRSPRKRLRLRRRTARKEQRPASP